MTQPPDVTTTTRPPVVPNINQPLPEVDPALEYLCVSLATAVLEQDQQRVRSLITALVIGVAESDVGSEDVRVETADMLQAIVAGEANSIEISEAFAAVADNLGVESCAEIPFYAPRVDGVEILPRDVAEVLVDLAAFQRIWMENGYGDTDYTIEMVVETSGLFERPAADPESDCGVLGAWLVTVSSGEAETVRDLFSGCLIDTDSELLSDIPLTVDEMFDTISANTEAVLGVTYHFALGYPTYFELDSPDGNLSLAVWQLNEGHPSDPEAVLAQAAHQESIWIGLSIDNYTLTLRRGCFCPPEITDGYTVTVSSSEPVRVERDGDIVQLEQFLPLTVEDLFDVVEDAAFADGLEIIYHGQWGFPIYIDVDPVANAVDEEYHYDVIDFVLTQ